MAKDTRLMGARLDPVENAGLKLVCRLRGMSISAVVRKHIRAELAQNVSSLLNDAAWPVDRVEDFLYAASARAENEPDWKTWIKRLSDCFEKLSAVPGYGKEERRAIQKVFRSAPHQSSRGGWTGAIVDDGTVTVEDIE